MVVTETERDAVKRREGLGNADRTSQKQQLRSLKSSTVNLSQKVMFAEGEAPTQDGELHLSLQTPLAQSSDMTLPSASLRAATANWAPNQSLKAEADRAAAAVDHAEDELKDWKNVAKQEEQQLQAGFALARTQHASYQAMNARIQQKLEALKKQEALQQQAQAALDAATATGSLNSQVRTAHYTRPLPPQIYTHTYTSTHALSIVRPHEHTASIRRTHKHCRAARAWDLCALVPGSG